MSGQAFRLPAGGRIDRDRPLTFTFDGRRMRGFAGDTLASALLANGVHMVGRSFKYHRPRGIFSAGAEEPSALVQLECGARTQPNLRATQIALYDGLMASSINRWPNLRWDAGSIVDRFSRLLPAGFYYKTFKGPGNLWRLYEPLIRRIAGLGRAPLEPDPDRYEKMHAHCDVLVVGAGPAGLAAALAAGRSGARVILADEQEAPGGSLLDLDGDDPSWGPWMDSVLAKPRRLEAVRFLNRCTVAGYYHHNFLLALERVTDHLGHRAPDHLPRQRLWRIRAKQVVLATGAIERPLVFADNDRPGIMLAGAARTYVNRYGVRPGDRAVVFANNDHAYGAALDLKAAGIEVAAIVDTRPDPGGSLPTRAEAEGLSVLGGHAVVTTSGRHRLKSVAVMALGEDGGSLRGDAQRLDCDLLCVSGGWSPTVHLFSQSGGKLRWDETQACLRPGETAQPTRSAGAANGTFGLAATLEEGFAAGAAAARDAGFRRRGRRPSLPSVDDPEEDPPRALWRIPVPPTAGKGSKCFIDLQNDVTAGDVALAAREGYDSVEHLKRYTTLGMGTDQGKTSNLPGLAILAENTGRPISEVGTTTFRPPYTPVTFGALAGRQVGELYDPVRRTAMHHWHERQGAVFEDVGQWKRPFYYPGPGETKHQAVDRECLAARNAIGILDASTLGKIDIQGPDAAEFLNRIYTNAWHSLKPGRCRYGLMLGEDGMVMDDGVTARLGAHHFLMHTTTGNAARVLAWLENWLQTEWPGLKVYLNSVTEHWATITLCGPGARALLSRFTDDIDPAPEALPFMSVREGTVAGVPGRVFRVSFTGEVSFEVNVPASHGPALWNAFMLAGEADGITPFGTEAMHVLRAEKGYIIAGQDTDGTVTPVDLGMDWILSKKKDFIGRRSLARADLARPDRKQLVGLVTEHPDDVLPEGGQVVAVPRAKPPMTMIGHVTSSYHSAALGRSIALALIAGGRSRHGDRVHVPLETRTIAATVTGPVFYDPEGTRLHG